MQTQNQKPRTAGILNHPADAEWMAFLYEELPPAKRRELGAHLANCAACAAEVQTWRSGINALDQWALPATRPVRRPWWPSLKWAAAAALALGFCFLLGRLTSPAAAQLAALKTSVARLEQRAQQEGNSGLGGSIEAATTAANNETLRLLAEFSRVQDEQRAADQQAFNLSLRTLNARVDKVRAELETVAVNTETGFQQTHENLTQLVSFSMPEPK